MADPLKKWLGHKEKRFKACLDSTVLSKHCPAVLHLWAAEMVLQAGTVATQVTGMENTISPDIQHRMPTKAMPSTVLGSSQVLEQSLPETALSPHAHRPGSTGSQESGNLPQITQLGHGEARGPVQVEIFKEATHVRQSVKHEMVRRPNKIPTLNLKI